MDRGPDEGGGRHRLGETLGSALEQGIREHVPKAFGTLSRGAAWAAVLALFFLAWKLAPGESVPHISVPIPIVARHDGAVGPPTTRSAASTAGELERLPAVTGSITVTAMTVVCPSRRMRPAIVTCVYEFGQFLLPARTPEPGFTRSIRRVRG
jgi:hypothetical protein